MRRIIQVMGTVVSVDVRQITQPPYDVGAALTAMTDWLHWVDRTFSTYRADSDISRLARREVRLADCHPEVAAVLAACAAVQAATDGYFSALYGGRIDPTGLVKGWAAQRASDLLRRAGLADHAIGAAGDVVCAGEPAPAQPWQIGIADPAQPGTLCAVLAVRDGAVATSGVAERGAHVLDPHTGRPSHGLASATVVGPDLGQVDAYATAALAGGRLHADWMDRLDGYQVLTIGASGEQRRTNGFPAAS